METVYPPATEAIFQRSLTAHLPPSDFERLQRARILVAGLGGGSNIAELLVRKGIGHLTIADLDAYEEHNVRQRGSLSSTWGRSKVEVMVERLRDVNPSVSIEAVAEGVSLENVVDLVGSADIVVDMLDFHALAEKVALYRESRRQGRVVVTAPSVVNGAILYVFAPGGPTFERFFDYEDGLPGPELGLRLLRRLIFRYPDEAPPAMYEAAARGERTLPLDAVGVDQAAVLAVGAIENLVLGRRDRVVFVPRGLQVDVTDPTFLAGIVDWSAELEDPA